MEIPTAGAPSIFDPISHHRPLGYYESIQCLSCRLEAQNYDNLHTYFHVSLKEKRKPLTAEKRLEQTKNRLRHKVEQKK